MAKSADPTQNGDLTAGAGTTEVTPLLGAPESGTALSQEDETAPLHANGHANGSPKKPDYGTQTAPSPQDDEDDKPISWFQIILLCYASLGEPVAYFAIFPFINEMVFRLGDMPESSVGFWVGLIESLFSIVQMVLMIFYGRAADRLGRKPVLVFSMAGVSVATACFGLSQTLGQMIAIRCAAGLFAGSVVTIRTMISENCTKKTQARAFSWYMFARQMGIFIGPLIGTSRRC
jgi:MFS-type transporter involved in bile tolerance (Atg22 family)